ncbi:hypothetical protein [Reinekea marinisedimentorum]|uniref:Uncharacterized protein n=1 Tax=Reinekea marinisedimentorum TaxID=230495 RepID=A0A4R3IBD1_9GAMM|nr:hypothetical protein [Reinekea marinisedimentorum]TCS43771.1 hypothetical protein BCF53_101114 [Reinekea marinisedimentorum]
MKLLTRIEQHQAGRLLAGILVCLCVYHLLILTGVVPYQFVWGGRLASVEQMYRFEAFSLLLNVAMLMVVLIRLGWLAVPLPARVVSALLWLMVLLFALNTVGNLFSLSLIEAVVFTPVTAACALLALRLAKKEPN